ncbi:phospholipid phosphatase 2-like [Mercenaria mercenaria]|uniref:phospholipid phosphatase 2-like n=1 Tax=Mercenaria mercenaria TaxID=6596 RepID=UPI00234F1440|nr:phospholipid phosphatase 2-like [Mercenaria mercenaria]
MKIESCSNSAMDKNYSGVKHSRRRITVQIIVDVIIWIAVSLVVIYLFLYGKPYKSGFFCDDRSLSYPSIPETISTPVLIAAAFTLSVILVVSVEILNCLDTKCRRPCQWTRDIVFCVKSYIVFMIGFLIQELVVDAVKNKMGVLRPNFFDVCKPQFNKTLCPSYISEYTCTRNEQDKEIRSSRQSFPSGHSALSMYIAVYFCVYIENRLLIRFSRLLKFFIQTGLVCTAILCGLERIKDNKHHPSDVIAGYVLGVTVAVFVHMLVGTKFAKTTSVGKKTKLNTNNTSCDLCCSCEQSPVLNPQTPTSALEDGYFLNMENGRSTSSTKLIALQNNNRNMSVTSEIV